jgi:hypothetical protein
MKIKIEIFNIIKFIIITLIIINVSYGNNY